MTKERKAEIEEFLKNLPIIIEETRQKISPFFDDVLETGKISPLIKSTPMRDLIGDIPFMNSSLSLAVREHCFIDFGMSLWCDKATDVVLELSKNLLAVGSGCGFIEYLLQRAGADIIATDLRAYDLWDYPHMNIERLSADDAIEKYSDRDLFLCWPSYNESWAFECIQKLKKDRLVFYVGEGGGCTADKDFNDYIMDNKYFQKVAYSCIPQWSGTRNCLMVFRKK